MALRRFAGPTCEAQFVPHRERTPVRPAAITYLPHIKSPAIHSQRMSAGVQVRMACMAAWLVEVGSEAEEEDDAQPKSRVRPPHSIAHHLPSRQHLTTLHHPPSHHGHAVLPTFHPSTPNRPNKYVIGAAIIHVRVGRPVRLG